MSCQFHSPPLYPRGKSPRYPAVKRTAGPHSQSGCYGENRNPWHCVVFRSILLPPSSKWRWKQQGWTSTRIFTAVKTSNVALYKFLHCPFRELNPVCPTHRPIHYLRSYHSISHVLNKTQGRSWLSGVLQVAKFKVKLTLCLTKHHDLKTFTA